MNFDFSDEQKTLQAEARRFLAAHCPPSRVRAVLNNPIPAFDEALWRSVGEQGWLGATIPEANGGLGLGYLELCCLATELGRALAPIPFASTVYLFAEALMLGGSQDQKSTILPKLTTGDVIATLAVSEGPGAINPAALKTRVVEGNITGVKIPVTDGSIANWCIVLADEGGTSGLFLVDLNSPGVTRETLKSLDPTRDVAKLTFSTTPAERLGEAGHGLALLNRVLDRAAILIAFEQCGGADRALEMARDYALDRFAFGRAIGGNQAIKHKLADIYVKNELARSNAYYGAWALNVDAQEIPVAASAARIAASDAYWFAAKEGLHIHGGIGFTWEMDCHLFYRRSRQLALMIGAPRHWKERLVSHLEHCASALG
jgi:alkylation response protein AidB-like acyl-CoA dehydrogenase